MDPRQLATAALRRAKDIFDVAGAGYALLTSEETRELVQLYDIELNHRGFQIRQRGAPVEHQRGFRRTVSWNGAVGNEAASQLLEFVFQKMISDSVDAVRTYSKAIGEWNLLKKQDWFAVGHHLRNAYAHNGKWHFEEHAVLPVTYRYHTLTREMHGEPAAGFLPYLDGQQLVAQMTLYVSGNVDYAQQPMPTVQVSS